MSHAAHNRTKGGAQGQLDVYAQSRNLIAHTEIVEWGWALEHCISTVLY